MLAIEGSLQYSLSPAAEALVRTVKRRAIRPEPYLGTKTTVLSASSRSVKFAWEAKLLRVHHLEVAADERLDRRLLGLREAVHHVVPVATPERRLAAALVGEAEDLVVRDQLVVRQQRDALHPARRLHALDVALQQRLAEPEALVLREHAQRVQAEGCAESLVAS